MRSPSLPTARTDWWRMARTTRAVLGRPPWLAVAVVASVFTLALFVAFTTPVYVRTVVIGGELSLWGRLRAFGTLFPLTGGSDHLTRDVLVYLTAGIVGTNVAVLGHHLKRNLVGLREGSGGLAGIALGTLGAGCAPCGMAVFAGSLSTMGLTAGLAALPLQGAEIMVVAFAVAVLSLHWVVDGTGAAEVEGCPVDRR